MTFNSYIWFNIRTQHSIFDEVLEADEHNDLDRHDDLAKAKLTFTECFVAIAGALVLVTLLAVFLVERIEDVVEAGVPDQFLGLIMLPFVEKAAEHLTAIDEAWDGQMVSGFKIPKPGKANATRILRFTIVLGHLFRLLYSTRHLLLSSVGLSGKTLTLISKSSWQCCSCSPSSLLGISCETMNAII